MWWGQVNTGDACSLSSWICCRTALELGVVPGQFGQRLAIREVERLAGGARLGEGALGFGQWFGEGGAGEVDHLFGEPGVELVDGKAGGWLGGDDGDIGAGGARRVVGSEDEDGGVGDTEGDSEGGAASDFGTDECAVGVVPGEGGVAPVVGGWGEDAGDAGDDLGDAVELLAGLGELGGGGGSRVVAMAWSGCSSVRDWGWCSRYRVGWGALVSVVPVNGVLAWGLGRGRNDLGMVWAALDLLRQRYVDVGIWRASIRKITLRVWASQSPQ